MLNKHTVVNWLRNILGMRKIAAPLSYKQRMVNWLRNVSTGAIMLKGSGLCNGVYWVTDRDGTTAPLVVNFIHCRMCEYAEKHGTSALYPVPHPTLTSQLGYHNHSRLYKYMNDTTAYGLNRRALAKWLADELDRSDI